MISKVNRQLQNKAIRILRSNYNVLSFHLVSIYIIIIITQDTSYDKSLKFRMKHYRICLSNMQILEQTIATEQEEIRHPLLHVDREHGALPGALPQGIRASHYTGVR